MKHKSQEEVDTLLKQLREDIADVIASNKKYDNDFYLYRWLIHNKMKVDITAKYIRESLEWRREMNIDELAEKDWAFWDPGLKETIEVEYGGISKKGEPLVTTIGENVDFREILQKHSNRSAFRFLVQYVAKLEKQMMDHYQNGSRILPSSTEIDLHDSERSKKSKGSYLPTGYYAPWNTAGPFIVVSLKNFSLWNVTCIEAVQIIAEVATTCMKSFPACACEIHFVNMNQFSRTVLSILKKVLNIEVYSIDFHGTDQTKWSKTLLDKLGADQLTTSFGGTKPALKN